MDESRHQWMRVAMSIAEHDNCYLPASVLLNSTQCKVTITVTSICMSVCVLTMVVVSNGDKFGHAVSKLISMEMD